ncbi:hypothetical protein EDD22DRAFT_972829 [Suillus occidentalis]|nr:hypothetical protein EDD22DRAFT_972829 [Suillus occidentalis]
MGGSPNQRIRRVLLLLLSLTTSTVSSPQKHLSKRMHLLNRTDLDFANIFLPSFVRQRNLPLVDVLRAPGALSFSSTSSASARWRFAEFDTSCSVGGRNERGGLWGGIVRKWKLLKTTILVDPEERF